MANAPTVLAPKIPNVLVTMDLDAFDDFIRGQGAKLKHYRAMRCPVGMTDMYDTRRPHGDHSGCSNGFIYELAGVVTCQFLSNSDHNKQQDVGQVDGSTVQASAPRFYDDKPTEPVHIIPFDRFYLDLDNITVVNWQLMEHNINGIDKLRYPVELVEALIDANGIHYQQGVNFEVRNGVIHWIGSAPGYDADAAKGTICSVRYRYRPYWYVSSLNHEIRLAQQQNPINGARKIERVGQAFSLTREYSFENRQNDSEHPTTDLRASREPDFGER